MQTKSPLIAYSHKYFQLTENCLKELISQGNKSSIRRRYIEGETEEESNLIYNELTRWSDSKIIEPILFNFYHAIELLLKGILILNNVPVGRKHNLEDLFQAVDGHLKKSAVLRELLAKYCIIRQSEKNILNEFFNSNNLTPSKYYIVLKYPFDNDVNFQYSNIHNMGNVGIELANEIIEDIKSIKGEFKNLTT